MSSFKSADEQEALTQGDFTYNVVDGKVTIMSFANDYSGPLIIPSTIDDYPVIAIGPRAFFGCFL